VTGKRRSSWAAIAALALAGACAPEPLDPGQGTPKPTDPPAQPRVPTTPTDLASAVAALAGPSALMIVGSNGGAVTRMPARDVHPFAADPGQLVAAAAAAGMPVCSVELEALALSANVDDATVSIDDALARCNRSDRLGDMFERLNGLRTPETVVIIAGNTGATVRSTNGGINSFYGEDILRLLWAARKLYVSACVVAPSDLALATYPEGQTPGLSIDAALAACGR